MLLFGNFAPQLSEQWPAQLVCQFTRITPLFSSAPNGCHFFWYQSIRTEKMPDRNKLDCSLRPWSTIGMSSPRVVRAVCESEEGGEGTVVRCSLPACEHDFLVKGFRPSRVLSVPLVSRASPVAASLGRGVERCQGGELRELALVEFISTLWCEEVE